MFRFIAMFLLGTACASCHSAASLSTAPVAYSRPQLQSIIEMLGSDHMEGRAPGTPGGDLAAEYVRSVVKLLGFAPGVEGDYLQTFSLRGFRTRDIAVSAAGKSLVQTDDVMGVFVGEEGPFEVQGEAVFVGFGIKAEPWQWDDFKDVDVRGKLVVARVNDPGMYDDAIFEGKTLTYYGRWTYHMEEAERRGARGILLIHTAQTAGYDWTVVQNSWAGESLFLESDAETGLAFRGWVREESFARLLEGTPHTLESLYEASKRRDFRPIPLGFAIGVKGASESRRLEAQNVVAEIPGQTDERIVLSAHIDHLGKDDERSGDNIYNGAIDNGSAVAAMLLTAQALAASPVTRRYTVTVLACHGEEEGLLGAKHFVRQADTGKIVANINFESTPVWGKATTLMGVGARFSSLEQSLAKVAAQAGLGMSEFSMIDQGFFYRSDQFVFAQRGIPALWISAGEDDDSGQRKYPAFWKGAYHTVDDEYDPSWSLEGLLQTIQAAVALVEEIDKAPERPTWNDNLPFPMVKESR